MYPYLDFLRIYHNFSLIGFTYIVFASKYHRKVFYEEKRLAIREILGRCINGEICPEHIHILVKYSAQNKRCGVHGVPEGEEMPDDLPKMGEMKFTYRNREL